MSLHKILVALGCFLAFVIGFLVGHFTGDMPYFVLDRSINILSLISLVVTIFIAFMVPFVINKLIDNTKGVKVMLVDELKELIAIVNQIKSTIYSAYSKGAFTTGDRDQIVLIFHDAELKISSLREQVAIAFEGQSEKIGKDLGDLLLAYDDFVTGGELMLSSFTKVNDTFYRTHSTEYSKIETELKKLIQAVYKF